MYFLTVHVTFTFFLILLFSPTFSRASSALCRGGSEGREEQKDDGHSSDETDLAVATMRNLFASLVAVATLFLGGLFFLVSEW
jgi:hypothetical protein